jgi:hypothetical protein
MTVPIARLGWTQLYEQMRAPTSFLTRRFTVKPGGFSRSKKVAIDIQRYGEDVAVVIKQHTGPNLNDFKQLTTKEFTPPSYGEAVQLDIAELLNRSVGVNPYDAAGIEYGAQLTSTLMRGYMLINHKIERAVELQAAQILQTGQLSLTNAQGVIEYTLDFKPKATHFPTVGTAWTNAATCTPLDDIEALAEVIRNDGQVDPDRITFGEAAMSNFMNSAQVQAALDNRRIELGEINPSERDSGATYRGRMWIGSYVYELWTYNGRYKDPVSGNPTRYVDANKVIVDSSNTRFDMLSTEVPMPFGVDPRVAAYLPGRMSDRAQQYDVTPNVYVTQDNRQIFGELLCNKLLAPVGIDGFGCLDT